MNPFAAMLLMSGTPGIIVDSADFDGANDYMTRGAGLTGAADSKTGIFSCWVRLDGGDGTAMEMLHSNTSLGGGLANARFRFLRGGSNKFGIFSKNAAGTIIIDVTTTNTYVAGATWRHILMSWDLSTAGARHLYMNDVSDLTEVTFTNDTLDYTAADWAIAALTDGVAKLNAALAELYFAPGQYLDFSVVDNRRKFITSDGKPAYLGVSGAKPTGTAPLIYMHLDDDEAVANFATNRGTGGNFTITGTLDTASTSPSD